MEQRSLGPLRHLSASNLICILVLLLPVVALISLGLGTVAIPFHQVVPSLWNQFTGGADNPPHMASILLDIRLPRILLALMTGAVLASTGAVLQGLFRNPLADPSLIGVSAGASVGASAVIVSLGGVVELALISGLSLVVVGAFAGGFVATILVYRIATSNLGTSVTTMLLAGIAIAALAGAANSLMSYFSDNQMLRQISVWQMGTLAAANWLKVVIMALITLYLMILLPAYTKALNALLLGESEARYLGIDVQRAKRSLILLTALGVGVSVALVGLIGFIGLVVPHMVRLMIGPDHQGLLPASALAGALLLLVADSLARVMVLPAELPTGILTALLGAPFFVALLIHQRWDI